MHGTICDSILAHLFLQKFVNRKVKNTHFRFETKVSGLRILPHF